MRGRKPSAPDAKVLRGTFRADRDAKKIDGNAARLPSDIGSIHPPPGLSPRARELFGGIVADMAAAGTASPTYTRAIALLAKLEARAEALEEAIGEELVQRVKTIAGDTAIKNNPALASLVETEKQIRGLLGSLGLTPDSIMRAPKTRGADGSTEANPFRDFG